MSAEEFNNMYKEGDFVVFGDFIVIFKELERRERIYMPNVRHAIAFYAISSLHTKYRYCCPGGNTGIGLIEEYGGGGGNSIFKTSIISPATNIEIRNFLAAIQEDGYLWDEKNKCLKKC